MSELRRSLEREPPPYAAPIFMLVIRAGHAILVTVVTVVLLGPESGGSIKRELVCE